MKRWIRLHTDLPANRKAQGLPPILFKFWVNCLALAGRSEEGYLPTVEEIAWELREKPAKIKGWMKDLVDARMMEIVDGMYQPHDWLERQFELSESALRVRKHRENKRLGVTGESLVSEDDSSVPQTVTVTEGNALRKSFSRASGSVSVSVSESVPENLTISPEEFEAAWERHRKHNRYEPKDLCFKHILSMNGKFSVGKFKERHEPYCEYWAEHGWQFCPLTFVAWIDAGMPLPPQEVKSEKENRLEKVFLKAREG